MTRHDPQTLHANVTTERCSSADTSGGRAPASAHRMDCLELSTDVTTLADPRVVEDPYPFYRYLRDREPVYWDAPTRSWLVARHADVAEALRRSDLFSSARYTANAP